MFEAAAAILSATIDGASNTTIASTNRHLSRYETWHVLKALVDNGLIEIDSSSIYWITVKGVKFLELRSVIDRMLRTHESLV